MGVLWCLRVNIFVLNNWKPSEKKLAPPPICDTRDINVLEWNLPSELYVMLQVSEFFNLILEFLLKVTVIEHILN